MVRQSEAYVVNWRRRRIRDIKNQVRIQKMAIFLGVPRAQNTSDTTFKHGSQLGPRAHESGTVPVSGMCDYGAVFDSRRERNRSMFPSEA